MSETDRRKFLAVAGGGAAVGLIGVTAGSAAASTSPSAAARKDAAREPVVAYVEDHRSGRLRLMVGDHEVVVHDPDLVTRILNAAGGK